MTKLTKHKLSDLYTLASGISSSKDQAGHGQPFLSFSTAFNSVFLPDTLPDLMASNEKEQDKHSIRSGDVFLTRTSEVVDELAISSVAVKDYPSATFSGFLKRLRPKESGKAYPKYMALYLRSQLFRKAMDNNAVMTLRASFNEAIFSYLDVWLPDYDKQVEIGDLLFAIEAKITLNNKINAEFEAMAKLVYDYWFIQFDFPDENGKPYRSSGGKMVWCDQLKRNIPEDWDASNILKISDVVGGGTPKKQVPEYWGDDIMFFTPTDAPKQCYCLQTEDSISTLGLQKSSAKVLPKRTTILTARGSVGKAVLCGYEMAMNQSCYALVPKDQNTFVYAFFLAHNLVEHLRVKATGSVFNSIISSDIETTYLALPSSNLIQKFSSITNAMFHKMETLSKENQELANLRDWLLPMLMNGQVTFGD